MRTVLENRDDFVNTYPKFDMPYNFDRDKEARFVFVNKQDDKECLFVKELIENYLKD